MTRKVGLWIDHAKAVVVALDRETVTTHTILCGAGRRPRVKGGAPSTTPYGPQDATYEARRDRRYLEQLRKYYDEIAAVVSGADSIFIMGPGQARTELGKRLQDAGVAADAVSSAASDKLTEAQVVEKVKIHYGYPTRESF
jgi:hypothetical protein